MKQAIVLVALLLTACAQTAEEISLTAHNGQDGIDAQNCLLSQTEGGYALSCGDEIAFVTNGTNGTDGIDGVNGTNGQDGLMVPPVDYTTPGCSQIAGTTSYVKVGNNNRGLYTSPTCASNTKYAEVSQGEAYWITGSKMWATYLSNGIRVLDFGGN